MFHTRSPQSGTRLRYIQSARDSTDAGEREYSERSRRCFRRGEREKFQHDLPRVSPIRVESDTDATLGERSREPPELKRREFRPLPRRTGLQFPFAAPDWLPVFLAASGPVHKRDLSDD